MFTIISCDTFQLVDAMMFDNPNHSSCIINLVVQHTNISAQVLFTQQLVGFICNLDMIQLMNVLSNIVLQTCCLLAKFTFFIQNINQEVVEDVQN